MTRPRMAPSTGHMSSTGVQVSSDAPRRHLSTRQAQTVLRLTDAAVEELHEVGYQTLTVRAVAKRAGVAPATAYTYFASKAHLIAEVFWRRIEAQTPRPPDPRRSAAARAADVLMDFTLVVREETELAAAYTVAMLADDADVRELRVRIALEMHRRLAEAVGEEATAIVLQTLELAASGALVAVGTGHLAHETLPKVLADVAALVLGGERP